MSDDAERVGRVEGIERAERVERVQRVESVERAERVDRAGRASRTRVIYRDLGLGRILRAIGELDETRVHVGVLGAAAEETASSGRATLGEVALINEYGTARIPARSFLREPISHARGLVVQLFTRAIRSVIEESVPVQVAADKLGGELAQVARNAIGHGIEPENAQSTVDKKGFDHPLVHTGELQKAISHRVVKGSSILEAGSSIGDYEHFEVGPDLGGEG